MLLVIGDALLVNGAVLVALCLWAWLAGNAFGLAFIRSRWFWFPLLTVLWWLLAALSDLYSIPTAGQRFEVMRRIVVVGLSLSIIYLGTYFLLPHNVLPRVFFLLFVGIALTSVVLWHWICTTGC